MRALAMHYLGPAWPALRARLGVQADHVGVDLRATGKAWSKSACRAAPESIKRLFKEAAELCPAPEADDAETSADDFEEE